MATTAAVVFSSGEGGKCSDTVLVFARTSTIVPSRNCCLLGSLGGFQLFMIVSAGIFQTATTTDGKGFI